MRTQMITKMKTSALMFLTMTPMLNQTKKNLAALILETMKRRRKMKSAIKNTNRRKKPRKPRKLSNLQMSKKARLYSSGTYRLTLARNHFTNCLNNLER